MGVTALKPAQVEQHLEDMRKKHGEVSDTTAPTVTSKASYTNVDLDDELCIEFSERIPKDMITSSNFSVSPAITGTLYREDTKVCLTPDANLTTGQTYTITANGAITDYSGNALGADASVNYTTTAPAANQAAVWNLANGSTQTAIEGSGTYDIDLTLSTDFDNDYLSYSWRIFPNVGFTVYNQSSGNIPIGTTTTIDFATADARTNTPAPLPAGDYRLVITQYEDRGSGTPVVTQQTVNITITAAAPLMAEISANKNSCNQGATDPNDYTIIFNAGNSTGNIQSYTWTTENQTVSGPTFNYTCTGSTGSRTVTLEVEDDAGATSTESMQFTVN